MRHGLLSGAHSLETMAFSASSFETCTSIGAIKRQELWAHLCWKTYLHTILIQGEGLPHFKCHYAGQFNIYWEIEVWMNFIDWYTCLGFETFHILVWHCRPNTPHMVLFSRILSLTSEAFADHALSLAWRWWQGWACHTWSSRWSMSLVACGLGCSWFDHCNIIHRETEVTPIAFSPTPRFILFVWHRCFVSGFQCPIWVAVPSCWPHERWWCCLTASFL